MLSELNVVHLKLYDACGFYDYCDWLKDYIIKLMPMYWENVEGFCIEYIETTAKTSHRS